MNWARAKTILIILFIMVDLLLIVDIFYYENISKSKGTGTISDAASYLKSANITINGQVPEKIAKAPTLICSLKLYSVEELRSALFPESDKVKVNMEPTAVVLMENSIRAWLSDNNEITYENSGNKSTGQGENAKEACQKQIDDFLSKLNIDKTTGFQISSEYKNGQLIQVYGQKYKDFVINQSYIEISAANTGVTRAKIHWLMSMTPRKDKSKPTTPYEMLLRFGYYFRNQSGPMTVKGITQGYFWDITTKNMTGTVDITVVPVWRYDTGTKSVYQNIYSGNIENRGP